jgi:hypothetical protein
MTDTVPRSWSPAVRAALLLCVGASMGGAGALALRPAIVGGPPPPSSSSPSSLPAMAGSAVTAPPRLRPAGAPSASVLGGARPSPAPSMPLAGSPPTDLSAAGAGDEVRFRAEAGELDALKRLEGEDERGRTAADALAIARGRSALALGDLASLVAAVAGEPALAHDRATIARLHDFVEREAIPLDALVAIAPLPGPESADLLHAVWRRHRHTTTGLLARDLLRGEAARSHASTALEIVISLEEQIEERLPEGSRAERRCARVLALLARAAAGGDRRCGPPLAELELRSGCGRDGAGDCYPCLREGEALARTRAAVVARVAPTPWVLPR